MEAPDGRSETFIPRTSDAKEHAEAARATADEIGMLGPDGPMPHIRKLLDG